MRRGSVVLVALALASGGLLAACGGIEGQLKARYLGRAYLGALTERLRIDEADLTLLGEAQVQAPDAEQTVYRFRDVDPAVAIVGHAGTDRLVILFVEQGVVNGLEILPEGQDALVDVIPELCAVIADPIPTNC